MFSQTNEQTLDAAIEIHLTDTCLEGLKAGALISPSKRVLEQMAIKLSVSPLNSSGNQYSTRQLGNLLRRSKKSETNGLEIPSYFTT